jgi:hypothetical protein
MVHRRGEEILRAELPRKRELVLKLALTPAQEEVYRRYLQVGEAHRMRKCKVGSSSIPLLARSGMLMAVDLCSRVLVDPVPCLAGHGGGRLPHIL